KTETPRAFTFGGGAAACSAAGAGDAANAGGAAASPGAGSSSAGGSPGRRSRTEAVPFMMRDLSLPLPLEAVAEEDGDRVHRDEETEQDEDRRGGAGDEAALGAVGPEEDLRRQGGCRVEDAGRRAGDEGVHA